MVCSSKASRRARSRRSQWQVAVIADPGFSRRGGLSANSIRSTRRGGRPSAADAWSCRLRARTCAPLLLDRSATASAEPVWALRRRPSRASATQSVHRAGARSAGATAVSCDFEFGCLHLAAMLTGVGRAHHGEIRTRRRDWPNQANSSLGSTRAISAWPRSARPTQFSKPTQPAAGSSSTSAPSHDRSRGATAVTSVVSLRTCVSPRCRGGTVAAAACIVLPLPRSPPIPFPPRGTSP